MQVFFQMSIRKPAIFRTWVPEVGRERREYFI